MDHHLPPKTETTSDRAEPRHTVDGHLPSDMKCWSIRGYGTADVSASGVDRSQLRYNMQLTPTERVEQMVTFIRFVLPLQGVLRQRRD